MLIRDRGVHDNVYARRVKLNIFALSVNESWSLTKVHDPPCLCVEVEEEVGGGKDVIPVD